jgi:hypothetical protein
VAAAKEVIYTCLILLPRTLQVKQRRMKRKPGKTNLEAGSSADL